MNCSRVRQSLPLLAGNDLSPRKARRVEKHLTKCPNCATKMEEIKAALAGVRTAADQTTLDWPEAGWMALMARVRSERPEPRRRPALLPQVSRRSWAYAAAGSVLVLVAIIVILKIKPSQPPAAAAAEITLTAPALPAPSLSSEQTLWAGSPQDRPFAIYAGRKGPDRTVLAAPPAPEKPTQDIMSMTLVSQETGLQVHWTFNRNFDWEEKKK